jgi:hypothetical protein
MGLGRKHQDRGSDLGPPQVTADVEPIPARQHHIEKDKIPARLHPDPSGLLSIADHFDFIAFLAEVHFQAQRHVRFIFDNKDPCHRLTS